MSENNGKKLLGIIGGMGAEAGAALYMRLVKLTPVEVDQDHIETFIYSNTKIPDRTLGILKKGPSSYPMLIESAKFLERNGVDTIILACVTSHTYIDQLRKELCCRVLSAVEESIAVIDQTLPNCKNVGILATTGTIKSELFQKAIIASGRSPVVLPDQIQEQYVMEALYGKDGIKAGYAQPARDKALLALNWLILNGAESIISGCSELPLLFGQADSLVPLIDAMDSLLKQTIFVFTGKRARNIP
jgi:aspartate racemase